MRSSGSNPRAPIAPWLAALSIAACGPPQGETVYHVVSRGMALPIVEFGAADAETAVVHLHGGPGESRLDTRLGAEMRIAQSALYVTWAQRTTPWATGPLERTTATLEQHVRDLEAVLAAVHARHPDKRVVLTGFSWGGAMTIEYMARSPASYVAGAVLIGALVDARAAIDDSWAMLRAHGEAQIAAGASNADDWRTVIDKADRYAQALVDLSPVEYLHEFVRPRVTACGRMRDDLGLPDNVENSKKNVYARYQLLPVAESVVLEWMVEEILRIDLRSRLAAIDRPVLVLWGELDCNTPRPADDVVFNGISTPAIEKARRVVPGVAHDVLDAAPAVYAETILEFIDGL